MTLVFSLLVAGSALSANCPAAISPSMVMQWSTRAESTSPNRAWSIKVKPALRVQNNRTPVLITDCSTGRSRVLFYLARKAIVRWGGDGNQVIIIDQPGAGMADFQLLRLQRGKSGPTIQDSTSAKTSLQGFIHGLLKPKEEVAFTFIKVGGWKASRASLLISGVAKMAGGGETRPFCASATLDTRLGRVSLSRMVTRDADSVSKACTYFP